jgi:hypothetical protein
MMHLEHRQYSVQKKVNLKGAQLSQRRPRNAGIAQRVLQIEVEKGLKSIVNPLLLQK